MEPFPDQIHLNRIREALWRGRQFGQASVMVGSGFSLNARSTSNFSPPFPTWASLASRFVDALHPIGSSIVDRDSALHQCSTTSGALRIAEEYQAAFGRQALDRFIFEEIPDNRYEPGHLHRLLLRLPWSDVLTTNYDTLLERAAATSVEHRYDVVQTATDIARAMKPRIVKLHGSLPSTRPFIITEEDFRTYPRRCAPFVNLAQQSIMENVFCLIGFSGDDPNFLYWTGWVRDNLGGSAPQIYLCGFQNLTNAVRNLLHDRNVVPVDLSPVISPATEPDFGRRYAKAIEWFLLSLEAGKPPDPLTWPEDSNPELTPPSPGVPHPSIPNWTRPKSERLWPT